MIQISGIRFKYEPGAAMGKRVASVEVEHGSWSLAQTYSIATNSMLSKGGHNQKTFLQGLRIQEHGSPYEVIRDWIARNSPIKTPELGRIAAITADK